jgi:hypothetical protein
MVFGADPAEADLKLAGHGDEETAVLVIAAQIMRN